jgi:glycosidase
MRPHPHLYEISAWPWLDRLSRQADRIVTLADVPDSEWDCIAQAGFDVVYLMGVWRRSAIGRLIARTDLGLLRDYERVLPGWSMRDVPGSPYSIQAYEPDDRMGGWNGLDRARQALARRGVGVVLDFVPNHTGLDHEWVRTRPGLYVEGTLDDYRRTPDSFHPIDSPEAVHFVACGRDPLFPPWRDVAQLNYFNPETREAMIGVLQTIADHADGVRCDMAMLVLNDVFQQTWGHAVDLLWTVPAQEFWPEATRRVPELTYLAEVYWDREWQLQQQGFAYTYDKRLLDRLHQRAASDVRGHLKADPAFSARLARFLENHDEARAAAAFGPGLPAAAAIALTAPGLRFYFDGQLDGAEIKPPVQLGRWTVEDVSPAIHDLYERVLRTTNKALFHDGSWELLSVYGAGDTTYDDLVAFSWRKGSEHAVIAANVSNHEAQGLVQLGTLPHAPAFSFNDQLSDQRYRWARDDLKDGLYVRLAAGQAHVFLVELA